MKQSIYEAETVLEKTHWWFVGRRKLFSKLIRNEEVDKNAKVVDLGSSTGTNLRMLVDEGFSDITGIDSSCHAVEFCEQKNLPTVQLGDICNLPFVDASIDFILATDVLEHLYHDDVAVKEIWRALKPGGIVLITVPMFDFLWGKQDDLSHHKRRYRKSAILNLMVGGKFNIKSDFYFNFFLLPPIYFARVLIKVLKIDSIESENNITGGFSNIVLTMIFSFDVWLSQYIKFPFGVSFLILAEKK